MAVPHGLWRLYGDAPFPRIQVLAGRTGQERMESLAAIGGADILVVAGGLGALDVAIDALSKTGIPCVFVLGPSELVGLEMTSAVAYARRLAQGTNVHVLDRDEVVIAGVRFLGATLWSSYSDWRPEVVAECLSTPSMLAGVKANDWWNDAENRHDAEALCRIAGLPAPDISSGLMHPAAAYMEHRRAVAWLNDKLNASFDGFTVVVSCNSPARASVLDIPGFPSESVDLVQLENSKYRTGVIRLHAETNDLRGVLRKHRDTIALWVHGLTAVNSDLVIEGVRVVSRSGRRARVDDDLPLDELMAREFSKHAPKKRRNKSGALPKAEPELLLHPEPIALERGLSEPLSAVLLPQADALSKHAGAIRAVIPHSMAKSAVLRACVRRVIHDELALFAKISHAVVNLEAQLSNEARVWVYRLASSCHAADCPKGYPAEMKQPEKFDYYATADQLDQRVDVVRDIPMRASVALARWAEYAHVALATLESLGVEGAVVRPAYHVFRRPVASRRIDIVVQQSETKLDALRAQMSAAHPRANEIQPVIRLLSKDSTDLVGIVLLDRVRMRTVIEHIEVPPVIERTPAN